MSLTWTVPADVTTRWVGGELPATPEQITTLLEDAEDLISREFPELKVGDKLGEVPLRRVKRVAARVVIRHLQNPSGVRSATEGAGPFQRSTTFSGDEPGALYLTDEDYRDLGRQLGGAFTIDTTPPLLEEGPNRWLPTWPRTGSTW